MTYGQFPVAHSTMVLSPSIRVEEIHDIIIIRKTIMIIDTIMILGKDIVY